jgi:isopenicillin-N epimerase
MPCQPLRSCPPMTDCDHCIQPSTALTRRELLAGSVGAATLALAASSQAQNAFNIPSSARELWQWVRIQPVFEPQLTYLDVASAGPTWRAAMVAEYRARETQSYEVAGLTHSQRWQAETLRLATRFASFLGCDADEICFTHGAGEALGMVASGLDLAAGDEIVTSAREHPAALSPWLMLARRRGVTIKQVELPAPMTGPEQALGLFAGAVTEKTKVLAFSHVSYVDGTLMPVRDLCQFARQRNILTVVDGAQAFGMLDFAIRDLDCDFYAASCHKWLGGCHGTGLLYVRREMLDRLWPTAPHGIDASPPVPTPTDALGWQDAPAALHKLGNIVPLAWPALCGSEVALEFHQQVNRSKIEARVRELAIYARLRLQQLSSVELLTPARPGLWAGILTLKFPGRSASELAAALARGPRLYVQSIAWPDATQGALRASFHIFNTHDDVDKYVQGLQILVR